MHTPPTPKPSQQIVLDESTTKEQLIAIARRYRPRIKGTSRYIPHQGSRETARRLRQVGAGHVEADAVSAGPDPV